MKRARWPGNWKYDCQRCGFTYYPPADEIKKEWTNLRVCRTCWEPKHPQLMIKVREETAKPPFINKDSITTYTVVCDIQTSSGYADLATADCSQADWNTIPYSTLIELYTHGHGDL